MGSFAGHEAKFATDLLLKGELSLKQIRRDGMTNMVFLGPSYVGKTHLVSALGLVAAQHRFSAYYNLRASIAVCKCDSLW